jgi:GMP synthase (glutamine-hydrolysing)
MNQCVLILRHMLQEPAGTLEIALTNAGLTFQYIDLFESVPRDLPLMQSVGLIVLGGPMNVDEVDKYPFLAREIGWLQAAMEQHIPVLGICLGAQLLAKSLGARVYPNPHKEVGWYPLEFGPRAALDPIFLSSGVPRVFQWHGDTFDLPVGTVSLARSALCANQAFRAGTRAWGLQFHIEMTAEMIENWVAEGERSGDLAHWNIDPHAIRDQTPALLPGLQTMATQVFGRFASLCKNG